MEILATLTDYFRLAEYPPKAEAVNAKAFIVAWSALLLEINGGE